MKNYILTLVGLLLLISCGNIDNYDAPEATISGGIYDAKTKGSTAELIPAQEPNGARIRLFQKGANSSVNFYCKMDGSFANTRVFAGDYSVIVEGPFVAQSIDTVETAIPAEKVAIYVEPCLRIKADAKLNGNAATFTYTVSQSDLSEGTCTEYAIMYSTSAYVDINNWSKKETVSVTQAPLGVQHTYTLTGIDTSNSVYVRVAAKSDETSYYNYSKVIKLK